MFKNKDNTRINRRPEVSKHTVNEKLRNIYSLPGAVRVTIQGRMIWARIWSTCGKDLNWVQDCNSGTWQADSRSAHTWILRFEPGPLLLAFVVGQFAQGHAFLRVFRFFQMLHTHQILHMSESVQFIVWRSGYRCRPAQLQNHQQVKTRTKRKQWYYQLLWLNVLADISWQLVSWLDDGFWNRVYNV
jgi:hypothetical protein